jgi:hypothetical protein
MIMETLTCVLFFNLLRFLDVLLPAEMKNPDYILNVGDNFYWGGIEIDCGSTPMSQISGTARSWAHCLFKIPSGNGKITIFNGKLW